MAKSQNGWSANDRGVVSRRMVPGTEVGLTVRNGPAGDLLLEVASLFDRFVQDIDNARGALDDWAYAERPIRGGSDLSNHASGTAIDLNATKWPLGKEASVNLNGDQIAKVRSIVAATGGVVRWGGDYRGRKDPMHFEINDGKTEEDCRRALDALRGSSTPAGPYVKTSEALPFLTVGNRGPSVRALQAWINGHNWTPDIICKPDGDFGPKTRDAVKAAQAQCGVTADGIVGPNTNRAFWERGYRG